MWDFSSRSEKWSENEIFWWRIFGPKIDRYKTSRSYNVIMSCETFFEALMSRKTTLNSRLKVRVEARNRVETACMRENIILFLRYLHGGRATSTLYEILLSNFSSHRRAAYSRSKRKIKENSGRGRRRPIISWRTLSPSTARGGTGFEIKLLKRDWKNFSSDVKSHKYLL